MNLTNRIEKLEKARVSGKIPISPEEVDRIAAETLSGNSRLKVRPGVIENALRVFDRLFNQGA